jgi:hypothetical protein
MRLLSDGVADTNIILPNNLWRHELKTHHTESKVQFSLCSIKHHNMKTYGGVEITLHAFLTSALDGDQFRNFRNIWRK